MFPFHKGKGDRAMKQFAYTIRNESGLHGRPAGKLAQEAKKYQSSVTVHKGQACADTRRLLALMGLGVQQGDTVTLRVDGPDEDAAAAALQAFLGGNNF